MLLAKRCQINRESLESQACRDNWDDFTSWLQGETGAHKAALSISRFTEFFIAAELRSVSISSYEFLLSEFGADYLRRHQKIIAWLVAKRGLVVDENTKKEVSELQRTQRILARVPVETSAFELIWGFWEEQEARYFSAQVSILTIRLGLTPAAAYLKMCDFGEPTSQGLAAYLAEAPGQRASIMKFVSYLNKSRGYAIVFPTKQSCLSSQKLTLEKRLVSLARVGTDRFDLFQWCEAAMVVFHGVKVVRKDLNSRNIEASKIHDGYYIALQGERYFVPSPRA